MPPLNQFWWLLVPAESRLHSSVCTPLPYCYTEIFNLLRVVCVRQFPIALGQIYLKGTYKVICVPYWAKVWQYVLPGLCSSCKTVVSRSVKMCSCHAATRQSVYVQLLHQVCCWQGKEGYIGNRSQRNTAGPGDRGKEGGKIGNPGYCKMGCSQVLINPNI